MPRDNIFAFPRHTSVPRPRVALPHLCLRVCLAFLPSALPAWPHVWQTVGLVYSCLLDLVLHPLPCLLLPCLTTFLRLPYCLASPSLGSGPLSFLLASQFGLDASRIGLPLFLVSPNHCLHPWPRFSTLPSACVSHSFAQPLPVGLTSLRPCLLSLPVLTHRAYGRLASPSFFPFACLAGLASLLMPSFASFAILMSACLAWPHLASACLLARPGSFRLCLPACQPACIASLVAAFLRSLSSSYLRASSRIMSPVPAFFSPRLCVPVCLASTRLTSACLSSPLHPYLPVHA